MLFVFAIVIAFLCLTIALVTRVARRRMRRRSRDGQPDYPLIFHGGPAARIDRPRTASPPAGVTRRPAAAAPKPAPKPAPVSKPVATSTPATRAPDREARIATDAEPEVASTVHFRRPVEHALQLLPGRLEVIAGEPRHKEIRLVRVPGEPPEVILGRERVDAPGQVALQSSTVSRRHARLAYANGVWTVANLSQTNPVVVNDEALAVDYERALTDGDRLELGEVVLRFHAG